jgi:hypothetical protein
MDRIGRAYIAMEPIRKGNASHSVIQMEERFLEGESEEGIQATRKKERKKKKKKEIKKEKRKNISEQNAHSILLNNIPPRRAKPKTSQ